jgi:Domain of unknown function (DUF4785) C-terminal domain/Domain of unknown function (DUF4785) N-terminal domain/Domain of unknown function (DUF4785) central domain
MKTTLSIIACFALALLGCPEPDQSTIDNPILEVPALSPGDMGVASLVTDADLTGAPTLEREALSASWALDDGAKIDLSYAPTVFGSKMYWFHVNAAELAKGVELPLTGPGGMVMISTRDGADLTEFVLTDRAGNEYGGGTGMSMKVGGEDWRADELPFTPDTLSFGIAPELGEEGVTLRLAGADTDAVIMVLDKHSTTTFTVNTEHRTYLTGETLTVEAQWSDSDGLGIDTDAVDAILRGPNGQIIPFGMNQVDGQSFVGSVELTDLQLAPGHLWEVEVGAIGTRDDALDVRRQVKTATGVALPTAKLGSQAQLVDNAETVAIAYEVEVGSEGRYVVEAALFGNDTPCAYAQSADWMQPGLNTLTMTFDGDTLSSCQAPFEIRDLRLKDQTRMGVLHKQAMGPALP